MGLHCSYSGKQSGMGVGAQDTWTDSLWLGRLGMEEVTWA